jgi:hypothetical protein
MHLAVLGEALDVLSRSEGAVGAEEVREALANGATEAARHRTAAVLEAFPTRGELALQTVMGVLSGLRQRHDNVRFNSLVSEVMLEYQSACSALEPSAQPPGTVPLFPVLWDVFHERRAGLREAFGPFLELGLERYWINDWYREPYFTSGSLATHAFGMFFKAATLSFLLVGHPVIARLARVRRSRTLELPEQALLEQAFVETVQIFVKHVERHASLWGRLDELLAPEKLGVNRITRAQLFATAC